MTNELFKKLNEMSDDDLSHAYMAVFNTPNGELILEDLKNRCFWYQSTYDGDVEEMKVNEGMRRVLLTIVTRLSATPAEPKE